MKHVFKNNQWQWEEFLEGEKEELEVFAKEKNIMGVDAWIKEIEETNTNRIIIDTFRRGMEWVGGSLVFKQDLAEKEENHIFHFYVTENLLITSHLDFALFGENQYRLLKEQMGHAENAAEGFSVLLGEIMTSSLLEIDPFEVRLNDLLWKMKEENSTGILDEIYQCRHELLVLKHLMIPIQEIKIALEEAFGGKIADKQEYKRTCLKIERGYKLINEYQAEIDTLINLEEVVSSHRGNEIMKTLTVLTTLFMPVTALGALWGMNFKYMPELKWTYGYLFAILLILLSTLLLYIVLKRKGWFGDILKVRKKNSFFK